MYALPQKVVDRAKGWNLSRISELERWAAGTEDEVDEGEGRIVIAQGVTSSKFVKTLGTAEKLPCKFALNFPPRLISFQF